MSMLYLLKPLKDRTLHSLCLRLQVAGVTPNMVTAGGLLLSVMAGLLAMYGHLWWSIALFLAGACLDAVDGSLARACGMTTEFGRYFDSFCDRLSELALVAGAVAGGATTAAFLVVVGSFALLVARIYNHRKGRDSNAAFFGRPERIAFLVAGLLAPGPFGIALLAIGGLLGVASSAWVVASGFGPGSTKMQKAKETADSGKPGAGSAIR